jgi:hypothetical protein
MYIRGEADLASTAAAIADYAQEKGVDPQFLTPEIIEADVRWYAREWRKKLGLPSVREAKASAKAKVELAVQDHVTGEDGQLVDAGQIVVQLDE